MKTPKATRYDCILFMLSQSLFRQTEAQNLQQRHTSADDEGLIYAVEQIEKVIEGDTFHASLVCANVALFSKIEIAISGINCLGLNGTCTEEKEQGRETQEVLFSCLSEAEKIEILICYPGHQDRNPLGSLYVDSHLLGEMLLKESFEEEAL